MTRLEWCNKNIVSGAELGMVSGAKMAFYLRYSTYINFKKDGYKHPEAIRLASEECSCDVSCVYKAIYFFSKNSKV